MKRWLLALAPVLLSCGSPPPVEIIDLGLRLADTVFVSREPAADLRRDEVGGARNALQPFVLGDGWAAAGEDGTWAVGLRAEMGVHLEDGRARTLVFEARSRPGFSQETPQVVTLEANGALYGSIDVTRRWSRHSIDVPAGALRPGGNDLALRFRDAISPSDLGLGDDTRDLAACFRRVGLLTESQSLENALTTAVERDPDGGGLRVVRSGTLVLPLELQPGRSRLTLRARSRGGRADLTAHLMDAEGLAEDLPNPESLTDGEWIALGPREGGLHFLLLDVDVSGESAIVIEQARLETPVPTAHAGEHRGDSVPGLPPDIVVLIPDALRPDHMGCYGSPRATSPNMDLLAAESLVFEDAVATASWTLCSTPTIITGTSFTEHGLVSESRRLPEQLVTLAEYLGPAGYATAAFTGNAYHSARFGSDQGYDTFEMTWRLYPGDETTSFDPHVMVDLATEWLQGQPGDRPVFLLLHLVPPHAPYDPPAPFDVFGDPDYRGPVDGSRANVNAIRTGEILLDEQDLQHLIGLYDGNILRVDDAIGQLLAALRSRPRWPETAVLVISDHGEAFFEHGFLGHVETVYEEMLRVPFVLRVPAPLRPTHVDLLRPVSLEDVVPTLVSLAGVEPAPEVTGLDLLAPPRSPLKGRDRWIISRNGTHLVPTYSVRTSRFKAVVDEVRRSELYDLEADPAERDNLAHRHPLLLAGFIQLLREELQRSGSETTESPSLAPEDEAALRALGYL